MFKKVKVTDAEAKFNLIIDIVKDLDKTEFKRFIDATTLAWQGYDKLLRVQTREEKETRDINRVEHTADMIETQKGVME